ncbi:hypothetical protein D1Y85_17990 [Paraburkholderia dinghuensis]|uniref:Uncharacterized protein n=1 Tax=Paraburkholderia dinghuensis TaxID=2305225 RepID=A0A3N6N8E7_9BURK|nr:hypothetical protein D1Y85_17990 [Paraburkholderia dinghuensis]
MQFDELSIGCREDRLNGQSFAFPPATLTPGPHAVVIVVPSFEGGRGSDALKPSRSQRRQTGLQEFDQAVLLLKQEIVLGIDVDHVAPAGRQFLAKPVRNRRRPTANLPRFDTRHRYDVLETAYHPAEKMRFEPAADVGTIASQATASRDRLPDGRGIDDVTRRRGSNVRKRRRETGHVEGSVREKIKWTSSTGRNRAHVCGQPFALFRYVPWPLSIRRGSRRSDSFRLFRNPLLFHACFLAFDAPSSLICAPAHLRASQLS